MICVPGIRRLVCSSLWLILWPHLTSQSCWSPLWKRFLLFLKWFVLVNSILFYCSNANSLLCLLAIGLMTDPICPFQCQNRNPESSPTRLRSWNLFFIYIYIPSCNSLQNSVIFSVSGWLEVLLQTGIHLCHHLFRMQRLKIDIEKDKCSNVLELSRLHTKCFQLVLCGKTKFEIVHQKGDFYTM